MVLQMQQVCQRVSAGEATFLVLGFLREVEASFFFKVLNDQYHYCPVITQTKSIG